MSTLTEKIDHCLPQTQCQQCGYPRCHDYAVALATNQARINRCPPGGATTRKALAELLGTDELALDPDCGEEGPRRLFYIEERHCIGCTLCIQACPVDAIIGSSKKMHTVIADECTGCGLCVPVCPVDCIHDQVHPRAGYTGATWPGFSDDEVERARRRTDARLQRLAKLQKRREQKIDKPDAESIRNEIAAAVARVNRKQRKS